MKFGMLLKWGVVIALLSLLGGCGFTTRTANSLPKELAQISYQPEDPYEEVARGLQERLRELGVVLVPTLKTGVLVLTLPVNFTYGTTSPVSTTSGRIYTMEYRVTIKLADSRGNSLGIPQEVRVVRDLLLQPNEIFETTSQVASVKQEMVQEVVVRILNVLCAKHTKVVLARQPAP